MLLGQCEQSHSGVHQNCCTEIAWEGRAQCTFSWTLVCYVDVAELRFNSAAHNFQLSLTLAIGSKLSWWCPTAEVYGYSSPNISMCCDWLLPLCVFLSLVSLGVETWLIGLGTTCIIIVCQNMEEQTLSIGLFCDIVIILLPTPILMSAIFLYFLCTFHLNLIYKKVGV